MPGHQRHGRQAALAGQQARYLLYDAEQLPRCVIGGAPQAGRSYSLEAYTSNVELESCAAVAQQAAKRSGWRRHQDVSTRFCGATVRPASPPDFLRVRCSFVIHQAYRLTGFLPNIRAIPMVARSSRVYAGIVPDYTASSLASFPPSLAEGARATATAPTAERANDEE